MKTKIALFFMASFIAPSVFAEEGNIAFLSTPFFSDSSLDFSTRNIWKYNKTDMMGETMVQNAWGQGVTLDFKSGYFADFIGVDASYYGVVKLGASDYFDGRAILYNDGTGFNKNNAKGFNKMGQIYGKMKFGDEATNLHLYGGWKRLSRFGVLTSSNRAVPNTYLGWSAEANLDAMNFRLAYVTKDTARNSPEKKHFQTQDGKEIDYIATGEIKYKKDGLNALYFYGESQDYMRRHGAEVDYKATENLILRSQIYGSYGMDNWKSMPSSRKAFDEKSWHYAVDAMWKEERWHTRVGFQYTQADKAEGLGYYIRHMSKNSRGNFNSMATAGMDYMQDDEKAFAIDYGYKFIPTLTTGVLANYGFMTYKGERLQHGEFNLYAHWAPSHKQLKGLSVFTLFGPFWTYKNNNNTPILGEDGRAQTASGIAADLIIDYKFNIF